MLIHRINMPSDKTHDRIMIGMNIIPGVREKLADYCVKLPAIICVEEVGEENEKDHIHILAALDPPVSNQTLRNRIKKHFGLEFKKEELYISEWKTDELKHYVCKGPSKSVKTPPVIFHTTWPPEEISTYHEAYWHHVASGVKSSPAKKTKRDADELCDEIANAIKHKYIAKNEDKGSSIEDCHNEICKILLAKKIGRIGDHIAFPYVQAILYRIFPRWVEADFQDRMKRKFNSLF